MTGRVDRWLPVCTADDDSTSRDSASLEGEPVDADEVSGTIYSAVFISILRTYLRTMNGSMASSFMPAPIPGLSGSLNAPESYLHDVSAASPSLSDSPPWNS
jgi:hypothetical protein